MMKLVTAIIKPHRLTDVKDGLVAAGVSAITVSEAKGFGRQGGHTETYRGTEYQVDFIPKIRLDVVTEAAMVDRVVAAIRDGANSGSIGDGKVWVTTVDAAVRIRTGETGLDAI